MSYIGQGGKHYGDAPVEVLVTAYIEPPKSWSKKKRETAYGKPHTKKPDADNIVKSVLDGLNGIAYNDDSQVFHEDGKKFYGEREHLWVTVQEA